MSPSQRDSLVGRVVYYSFFALSAAFVWFIIGLPAWYSYHTDIAFQSFIAFSTIACMAISLLAYKEYPSPFLVVVLSALFFAANLHTGFAIITLYRTGSPLLIWSTRDIFNGLLELGLFSCLLYISVWSNEKYEKVSGRQLFLVAFIMGIAMLLIYAFLSEFVLPALPLFMIPLLGFIIFGMDILLLGATSLLVFRSSVKKQPYSPSLLIVSCLLLAASSIPLIIPLFEESAIWTFSVTLHSVAFFVLYLSLCVPYLRDVGMKRSDALVFASAYSVLFLAPFIVTLVVEGLTPGFYNPDVGAYTIIHLGAASLSAVMALLTFGHARTRGQKNLYPLIFLFASWTVVDVAQVIFSRLPSPFFGESLVPYITGSLVSLIALYIAIRWTINGVPSKLPPPFVWPIFGVLVQTGLVIMSEWIQASLTEVVPVLIESPLGRSVLLVVNLFAMFEFSYFIVYLSRKSGGGMTVEVLLTGFLSLWILPNLLKANFLDWTAGWYSAEVLLLVALLFGPAVLGLLYLTEMEKTANAHHRARVYSDLLVHDISNYHQAIMISLGLLEVRGIQESLREQVVNDAQIELQRASELIRNVRQLGKSEQLDYQDLECLDLVQCIRNSYENATPSIHRQSIEFSINRNLGECFVQANPLIEGIFTNLLRNAIQFSPDKKRVEVKLELSENPESAIWTIRVIDYGQGIEPEKKANLFNRFMTGARG
ncbi:MAG: sensor histidine kinase, partial [Promethearchaeota archaeon]